MQNIYGSHKKYRQVMFFKRLGVFPFHIYMWNVWFLQKMNYKYPYKYKNSLSVYYDVSNLGHASSCLSIFGYNHRYSPRVTAHWFCTLYYAVQSFSKTKKIWRFSSFCYESVQHLYFCWVVVWHSIQYKIQWVVIWGECLNLWL